MTLTGGIEFETQCDEAFLEEVSFYWKHHHGISGDKMDRLQAIARRCSSTERIEAENKWLRDRLDALTETTTTPK